MSHPSPSNRVVLVTPEGMTLRVTGNASVRSCTMADASTAPAYPRGQADFNRFSSSHIGLPTSRQGPRLDDVVLELRPPRLPLLPPPTHRPSGSRSSRPMTPGRNLHLLLGDRRQSSRSGQDRPPIRQPRSTHHAIPPLLVLPVPAPRSTTPPGPPPPPAEQAQPQPQAPEVQRRPPSPPRVDPEPPREQLPICEPGPSSRRPDRKRDASKRSSRSDRKRSDKNKESSKRKHQPSTSTAASPSRATVSPDVSHKRRRRARQPSPPPPPSPSPSSSSSSSSSASSSSSSSSSSEED